MATTLHLIEVRAKDVWDARASSALRLGHRQRTGPHRLDPRLSLAFRKARAGPIQPPSATLLPSEGSRPPPARTWLLACQRVWQLRTRLSRTDILMREERRRSEDCLPIWRQMLLPEK